MVIGFLVIALLNGMIRPSSVVAAKVGLAPGTLLAADLVESYAGTEVITSDCEYPVGLPFC
jgi:hypothetical protein